VKRLAASLALLAGGLLSVPRAAAQNPADREPIAAAWSRPAPGLVGLAVSPDGQRVVGTLLDGTVRGYDAFGSILWELPDADADTAAVSRRGSMTVAYALRQPLSRKAYFLDESGKRLGTVEPADPIEGAAVSSNGRYAALVAGKNLIFCSRIAKGVTKRTLPLPGRPVQVQMGPDDTAYVACVEPDYMALVKSDGKELWRRQEPGAARYAISASEEGRHVAVSAELGADQIRTWLLSSKSAVRWADIRPGRKPRPRVSANGTAVVLSYEFRVESPRGPRMEQRLTYLGPGVGGAWPKGGPFNTPLQVAIERDGDWLVALDQPRGQSPRFRLYGKNGERRWLYASPSNILIAAASSEGRAISTYRADGVLELLRVSAD
jgi:hypothetical protein